MLISNSCYKKWTLVDDEGTNLNTIPQGAFFELDIDSVTYYGAADFDATFPATTLVCRLYSDAERTLEVVAGTFTGLPYVIRFFGGWVFDFSNQGAFGRWVSNEVTIYQEGGKWVGRWVATPQTNGTWVYSFEGEFIVLPLSVYGLTAEEVAGTTLAAGTYCYRVVAVDGSGNRGPASPVVCITLAGTADVQLSWAPTPGAAQYEIYGRESCPANILDTIAATPDVEQEWPDDGGAGTPQDPPDEPDEDIEEDCPFIVIPNGDGTYTTLQDCDEDGCYEGTGPLGGTITICIGEPQPPPDPGEMDDDESDDDGGVIVIPVDPEDEDGPVIVIPIDPDGNPDDTVSVVDEDETCVYRRIGPGIEPAVWEFTSDEELKVFTLTNAVDAFVYSTRPDFFEVEAYDDDSADVRFHSTSLAVTGFAIAYNSYLTITVGGVEAEIDVPEDYVSRNKTGRLNLYEFVTGTPGFTNPVAVELKHAGGTLDSNLTNGTLNITNGSYSMLSFILEASLIPPYAMTAPGVPTGDAASIGTLTLTNGWSTTVLDLYVEAP